jgi:hypothetical protein
LCGYEGSGNQDSFYPQLPVLEVVSWDYHIIHVIQQLGFLLIQYVKNLRNFFMGIGLTPINKREFVYPV